MLKQLSWRFPLVLILLGLAVGYVWILPLFQPRGDYLWGHYRLKDIYLGIPVAVATVCALLIFSVPARYRRPFSLRITTLAITLLIVLACFDVIYAFAIMGAGRPNFWLDQAHISRRYSVADDELGFVRKPGVKWKGYVPELDRFVSYSTDENGFRNSSAPRSADIVFIGDSFTEAATVEEKDTFVQQVARLVGHSVINLGRGAYSPQQELIVLKRYGLAYKPRIVVWQLFEGNDLNDAENFTNWTKNPDQLVISAKDRYFDSSFLADWLANTRLRVTADPTATIRYQDGTTRRVALRYPYDPAQLISNSIGMRETLAAIETGQLLCQSQGIELLIVMVPTMAQVMEPYLSFERSEDRHEYFPGSSVGDGNSFSSRVEKLCADSGCTFIDGVDAFREAAANDNRYLYIPNDEHLDVRGHTVIAQTIAEWVQSKNLISKPNSELH